MIFPWVTGPKFNDFSMIFFHFHKFQELFMKFNDFSMILKQIWISMIFQELWEPCECVNYIVYTNPCLPWERFLKTCSILMSRNDKKNTQCTTISLCFLELLFPTWISNHMPSKVWNEITYPFPNFNRETVGVWEWISNFIPHFTMDIITYPCSNSTHELTMSRSELDDTVIVKGWMRPMEENEVHSTWVEGSLVKEETGMIKSKYSTNSLYDNSLQHKILWLTNGFQNLKILNQDPEHISNYSNEMTSVKFDGLSSNSYDAVFSTLDFIFTQGCIP